MLEAVPSAQWGMRRALPGRPGRSGPSRPAGAVALSLGFMVPSLLGFINFFFIYESKLLLHLLEQ